MSGVYRVLMVQRNSAGVIVCDIARRDVGAPLRAGACSHD